MLWLMSGCFFMYPGLGLCFSWNEKTSKLAHNSQNAEQYSISADLTQ